MNLTKQIKTDLAEAYQCVMQVSILNMKAPLRYINQYIAENVGGYGTAADEKVVSRDDFRKMLMKSRQQSKGMLYKAKITTPYRPKFVDETTAIFHNEILLQIGDKNNMHSIHLKMSCVFKYLFNKWQMVLFHGSMPDVTSSMEDTFHLGEAEKKLKELELLVEKRTADLKAKTRELAIEASLERVRAIAMGMKQPADMLEVCRTISDQLELLGVKEIRNVQTAIFYESKGTYMNYEYYAKHNKTFITEVDYKNHKIQLAFAKKMLKGPNEEVLEHLKEKKLQDWYHYQKSTNQFADKYLLKAHSLNYYWYSLGPVALGISTYYPLITDETLLFKRFLKVFELAYRRYLDIEKAEAQAREAQIELALERVRAKSMAMKATTEIGDLIYHLYGELTKLDASLDRCFIMVVNPDNLGITWWMAGQEGLLAENGFFIPMNQHASHLWYLDCWKNKKKKWQYLLEGKEKRDWDRFGFNKTDLARLPVSVKDFMAGVKKINLSGSSDQFGSLVTGSFTPLLEEHQEIISRFAIVFNQTYTRFLDLQKAEAQTKEAQIEGALERVRSRTMAMQHSNELPEAANLLFLEVQALGIPSWSAGYNILAEDKKSATCWMSSEGTLQKPFQLRLWGEASFDQMGDFVRSNNTMLVQELGDKAIDEHYAHMKSFPDLKSTFDDIEEKGLSLPTYQINHLCKFTQGFVLFITYEKVPEAHDIFKRFTKVFEQTYTRFLDLQRAEAQTRQAHIETALERVRARALAMQEPEELKAVAEVLRHEMGLLGVEELETCSIYINDEQTEKAECWYALKDIHANEKKLVNDHFKLNLNDTWVGREMLSFYNSSEQQISIVMQGANRKEWINYCEVKSAPFRGYYGQVIPDRTYHLYKFSHGAIGAASAGDISDESWGLLKRAASVFSLAYSRFKDLTQARIDLQRLKEEKQKAENALTNLQAAQKQLIQSEKMASLGELTAGIAHEIQNPLNFVNNFSEVSRELLDELKPFDKLRVTAEQEDLLNDIDANLEKINHHGQRAADIVKGMLQHSRSSSGTKEPTDINALCDEYLRLSYHGLRAKDKNFNATMKTDFDVTIGNINVVPQDIGRVVLNLLTNAFYAVDEKKKSGIANYEPTVSVSTKKVDGKVEISVTDNGNGIPQKVSDKIFQPFFTTKPTGQGTGLGLSLSYDIVKAHGGKIQVETLNGEGTNFTILIPLNQ